MEQREELLARWGRRFACPDSAGESPAPPSVYLDCAATSPLEPRVRDVLLRQLDAGGNAGSRTHEVGRRARAVVEQARQQVGAVVNASRGEVVFTSGATESNNLAILGLRANSK